MIRTSSLIRTANRARRSTENRSKMSTWKITRRDDEGSFDNNGQWIPPTTTLIYEGPAFLEAQAYVNNTSREDGVFWTQTPHLRITATHPTLKIGDIAEPVKSRDATVIGRSWKITGEPASSYGVHRFYPLAEVTP